MVNRKSRPTLCLLLLLLASLGLATARGLAASDEVYSSKDFNLELIQNPFTKFGEGKPAISDINILLPIQQCRETTSQAEEGTTQSYQMCRSAFKMVYAMNGCFQWKISHPKLVKLQQFKSEAHPECSNYAEVSNLQSKETKTVVRLTATEQHSKQVLTSQVKVAKIERLEITSRFKQMNKEDQQHLYVVAYDDEGNAFSSLDGFRFDWDIISGQDNIRRIKVKDSHMNVHGHSHLDDSNWIQSDEFVLRATQIGFTELQVKIQEPGYEAVKPASIKITIVEPFVILPAHGEYETDEVFEFEDEAERFNPFESNGPIRILPTSYFDFKLSFVKTSSDKITYYEDISPENSKMNYNWTIPDKAHKYGSIATSGRFSSRNMPGPLDIVVIDKKFLNNTAEVDVLITEPFQLRHVIADVTDKYTQLSKIDLKRGLQKQLGVKKWQDNWVLVRERYYLIKVYLLDKENNPIRLTENLQFNHKIDSSLFTVIGNNSINSEVLVKANALDVKDFSKTVISSTLKEIRTPQKQKYQFNPEKLKDETDVIITGLVSIVHPNDLILLPLVKDQIWKLRGVGGTGSYHWESLDPSIAYTTKTALVQPRGIGKTQLKMSDAQNPYNFVLINLEVQHVSTFIWLENQVEMSKDKNEKRVLYPIAIDSQGRRFTNCSQISLQYQIEGPGIYNKNSQKDFDELNQIVKGDLYEIVAKKYLFDQEPNTVYWSDLKKKDVAALGSKTEWELTHNNFGICGSLHVQAVAEGKSEVKAFFDAVSGSTLVGALNYSPTYSEEAIVFSYSEIRSRGPNHDLVLGDLWAQNQSEKDITRIKQFYPKQDLYHYQLTFGSSFNWELAGGSIGIVSQQDNSEDKDPFLLDFQTSWSTSMLQNTQEDLLQITNMNSKLKKLSLNSDASTLIQIKCQNPSTRLGMDLSYSYSVQFTQQAQLSKYLLRPKVHEEQIQISCSAPQSQFLNWAQKSPLNYIRQEKSQMTALPLSKIVREQQIYYVLTDSTHVLKNVFVGSENQVLISHSSILSDFSVSNNSLAKLEHFSSVEDIEVNDFFLSLEKQKKFLRIGNQTGSLVVTSRSFGYRNEMFRPFKKSDALPSLNDQKFVGSTLTVNSQTEITSSLQIEIVESHQIEPPFKSIYFKGAKNNFTFSILKGSGEFSVRLDSDKEQQVDLVHRGREVTIVPKVSGSVSIWVKDLKLPQSKTVKAELMISEVSKIDLQTDSYFIEENQKVNMTVTAYDTKFQPFDLDQYEFMDFQLQTVGIYKHSGLPFKVLRDTSGNRRIFEVFGDQVGNYQVNAYLENLVIQPDQEPVTLVPVGIPSISVKIEVFPPLQLSPDNLLLTPNMSYTITIKGGPQSIFQGRINGQSVSDSKSRFSPVHCFTSNKSVASIDSENGSQYREITGHSVGNASLVCKVVHQRSFEEGHSSSEQVISQTEQRIRIRLVTSVEIANFKQNVINVGSMVKHLALLKYQDERFSFGLAPISFSWESEHPSIFKPVPQVDPGTGEQVERPKQKAIRNNIKNDNNAAFTTSFNSSSVYSKAKKAGETSLLVKVAIEYPQQYAKEQNWFNAKVWVKIQESMNVAVHQYIADSDRLTHQFLLPPNAQNKIQTNKQSQLSLHYSKERVPLKQGQSQPSESDTKKPLIELGKDDSTIKTLGRYGQVTLMIQEDQGYGSQVAMLNLFITDIFSLVVENFYEVVSLAMDTTYEVPIKFQNEHAHVFASNIEGIGVIYELSHPRVLSAELDEYNQTLVLTPKGHGECNVLMYLEKNPEIFDIIKIRISTLIEPASPLLLNVGSEVQFKFYKQEVEQKQLEYLDDIMWLSSNPQVLDINPRTGVAHARISGIADIKGEMAGGVSGVTKSEVSKIAAAQIVDTSSFQLDINQPKEKLDVNFVLFFEKSDRPVKNKLHLKLTGAVINQNIGLICESDHPELIKAEEYVKENYFSCQISFAKDPRYMKNLPSSSRIKVSATGGSQKILYKKEVAEFSIQLVGEISEINIKEQSVKRAVDRPKQTPSQPSNQEPSREQRSDSPDDSSQPLYTSVQKQKKMSMMAIFQIVFIFLILWLTCQYLSTQDQNQIPQHHNLSNLSSHNRSVNNISNSQSMLKNRGGIRLNQLN